MMRFAKYVLIAIMLSLLLCGCSKNVSLYREAKKHYDKGDFEAALDANIRSLLIKPAYDKAQDLLKETYPKAIKKREDSIRKLQSSDSPDRWDSIVPEYQALVRIQDLMQNLPRLVHPKTQETFMYDAYNYRPVLTDAQNNAAEYHYQKGIRLAMQSSEPDIQKEAAKEFKQALAFVSDYKDASVRYDQSRKKAIKRIAILAFENKTGEKTRYAGIPDMLESNIVSSLINDKSTAEFLEIISRNKIDEVLQEQQLSASGLIDEGTAANFGQLLGAHEILSGKILQVEVLPSKITSVELKESKTVEIEKGDAEIDPEMEDDDPKPVTIKQDVFCLYDKYTKTASAQITASYTIVDVATGKIKIQDTYTGIYSWSDTWARKKNGDDRALTPATKALIAKEEPIPPSETSMINQAINDLGTKFINQIKKYVK